MARRIEVEIVGDSRSLQRAFAQSERSAKKFHGEMERAGRGAVVASVGFRGLGRAAAYASAQFLGGAGVVYAIKSTVDAAEKSQQVMAETRNALERTGLSWARYGNQIEETTLAQSKMSGFDDERLKATFSLLVRRTHNVTRALQLNATAANVARGANIDLETAAKIVQRASIGQARGLAALGIQYNKTSTGAQLLAQINQKYAGSAAAYANTAAGAQDRFRVAVENLQEALGVVLLPTITKVANGMADWLNNTQNQQKIVDDFASAVHTLGGAFLFTANAIQKATAARNAIKNWGGRGPSGIDIYHWLFGGGGGIGGDFAAGGKGGGGGNFPIPPVAGPGGTSGAGRAGQSAHELAVLATRAAERSNTWFDAMISRMLGRAGDPTSLKAQISRYRQVAALLTQRLAVTKDITRRLNLQDQIASIAVEVRGRQQQIAANRAAAAKAAAQAAAAARQATRDRQLGWLDFAIERAGATTGTADDRKALRAREAYLKDLIRHEGRTLELVRELWRTRQQIADLNKKNTEVRFHQVSAARVAQMLGVGGDPRALMLLAALGRGGTLPTGSGAFAGTTVVHGGLHLHGVQNVRQLSDEIEKQNRGRAATRRGAR